MALDSMSAFASKIVQVKNRKYRFVVKCVNNRSVDFKMRAPREWNAIELQVRGYFSEKLHRGSFDIQVDTQHDVFTDLQDGFEAVSFLKSLREVLRQSRNIFWWPLRFYALVHNGALLTNQTPKKKDNDQLEFATDEVQNCLNAIVLELKNDRAREGQKLQTAIHSYLSSVEHIFNDLKKNVGEFEKLWKLNIKEKFEKITKENGLSSINEERVNQEILILAEKRTVEEEIVRIDTHLEELKKVITENSSGTPIGKRVEYLLQELHREWTTFGNKIQNSGISHRIIDAKLELEKIREQSLNIL
jgi:uncharacterized protein (TIGR00255 family)